MGSVTEIAEWIVNEIEGRAANNVEEMVYLGEWIRKAGNGDHIEIGTLFGASAIMAFLVKRQSGFTGRVICVDPLDGYYRQRIGEKREDGRPIGLELDPCGLQPSLEILERNVNKFGACLEIVQRRSYPWPERLLGRRFSTAYIDGDHWGNGPLADWNNLKCRVEKYILFDNYEDEYSEVMHICKHAEQDPGWKKAGQDGVMFVLENTDV